MPPSITEINRLQAFLRESARRHYDSVALPPFTLFFHPSAELKYFNYAIPDAPTGPLPAGALDALRAAFHGRKRTPRFEFFEAFAPALPAALRAEGFVEEGRQWSMICAKEDLRSPEFAPDFSGLELLTLGPDAAGDNAARQNARDFMLAQRQGFDPGDLSEPQDAEITETLRDFSGGDQTGFLARVDGEPAAAGGFGRIIDGLTEIGGIATRTPFRRHGLASALTYRAVAAAFQQGADLALLTAEDEAAGRVYQRLGFRPFTIMLAYIDGEAARE